MRLSEDQCWARLRRAEHGVLCTVHPTRAPDAVPVCFAVVGRVLVTPVDRVKPKDTTQLARVRNLERDARATLLCERWDGDDWSRLWWVRADLVWRDGGGGELQDALRRKYRQYREPETEFARVLVFDVERVSGWAARG